MKNKIEILMQMISKKELRDFRKKGVSFEDFVGALRKKSKMFFYVFDKHEIRAIYDHLMTDQINNSKT